jgi:porphobilinogen synthase
MVHEVKDRCGAPTYAYQVSGECAIIMAASESGWFDWNKVVLESLISFRHAGCDAILTFFAPWLVKALIRIAARRQSATMDGVFCSDTRTQKA